MFTDKTRPQNGRELSTVSTVSRFFTAPGVKKCDTVETVDSSAQLNAQKPQIDGYIVAIETATGTWYYGGRSVDGSVFGWTQYLRKAWIYPAEYAAGGITQIVDAIRALVGDQAIAHQCVLPVRRVPVGRCEIVEE